MRVLLAHGGPFTPDAFAEYQVKQGVFFGVEDGAGGLAAVGGTHIVDYTSGVAAIGNMYTRPDCRGRGYAGAILGAIVAKCAPTGPRPSCSTSTSATRARGGSTSSMALSCTARTSKAWRRRAQ